MRFAGKSSGQKAAVCFEEPPSKILFIEYGLLFFLCQVRQSVINVADVPEVLTPAIRTIIDSASMYVVGMESLTEFPYHKVYLNKARWEMLHTLANVRYFGTNVPGFYDSPLLDYQCTSGAHILFEKTTKTSDAGYADLFKLFLDTIFAKKKRNCSFEVTIVFTVAGWVWIICHRVY